MSDYRSGFCITKHHENCHYTLSYYDKTWVCQCECHASVGESVETDDSSAVKSSGKHADSELDKQPNSNKNTKSNKKTSKGSDK